MHQEKGNSNGSNNHNKSSIEVTSPSETMINTCAVKLKDKDSGSKRGDLELSSPENYNSNSNSSYEKYDNTRNDLDCDISDDD